MGTRKMENSSGTTRPTRNRKGQVVDFGRKESIIYRYEDLLREYPGVKNKDLMDMLSEESGIGVGTIKKIVNEYVASDTVSKPKNKKMRPTVCDKINDHDKCAIRQTIHGFWWKREIPCVAKVLRTVNDDGCLPNVSRSSFYRLLNEMQFEYTKVDGKCALIEREALVINRRKYIADVRRYRREGRPVYYLDEMWVDVGRRKRLIVAHVGSAEGFVEGSHLCYVTKTNAAGRHRDGMDGDAFFDWFRRVLPLLKDGAVVVMDGAPRHCATKERVPTAEWTRAAIEEWLESKGEPVDGPVVKFELLRRVGVIAAKSGCDAYVADEEADKHGKTVLRLPPYHCVLNPIEAAWSDVKKSMEINITSTSELNDVWRLVHDCMERVTPNMWSNFVWNAVREEDTFWDIDFLIDDMLEERMSHILKIAETSESEENC